MPKMAPVEGWIATIAEFGYFFSASSIADCTGIFSVVFTVVDVLEGVPSGQDCEFASCAPVLASVNSIVSDVGVCPVGIFVASALIAEANVGCVLVSMALPAASVTAIFGGTAFSSDVESSEGGMTEYAQCTTGVPPAPCP